MDDYSKNISIGSVIIAFVLLLLNGIFSTPPYITTELGTAITLPIGMALAGALLLGGVAIIVYKFGKWVGKWNWYIADFVTGAVVVAFILGGLQGFFYYEPTETEIAIIWLRELAVATIVYALISAAICGAISILWVFISFKLGEFTRRWWAR